MTSKIPYISLTMLVIGVSLLTIGSILVNQNRNNDEEKLGKIGKALLTIGLMILLVTILKLFNIYLIFLIGSLSIISGCIILDRQYEIPLMSKLDPYARKETSLMLIIIGTLLLFLLVLLILASSKTWKEIMMIDQRIF